MQPIILDTPEKLQSFIGGLSCAIKPGAVMPSDVALILSHPSCFKIERGYYVVNHPRCYLKMSEDEIKDFFVAASEVDAWRLLKGEAK